jgi:acetylglutamate kinase
MIVVKFGGHAMKDENGNFAKAISGAITSGEEVVVVHGGGPQIDAELSAREIASTWLGGFRVTTQEVFQVVEQVLVHQVGPEVANNLSKAGLKAVAFHLARFRTCRSWQLGRVEEHARNRRGFEGGGMHLRPRSSSHDSSRSHLRNWGVHDQGEWSRTGADPRGLG